MQTSTTLLLLGFSLLGLHVGGPPSMSREVAAPGEPRPSGEPAPAARAPEDAREALLDTSSQTVRAQLFADGSVSCAGADDTTHRVGAVELIPKRGGIAFRVLLRLGDASADWPYYVELSQDGTCHSKLQYHGFVLGEHGNGVFTGFYPTSPGPRSVMVDLVSEASVDPPDPSLREIATNGLMRIDVPDDGSSIQTLGFDAGPGSLPWSEQGFTFAGDGTVAGPYLGMVSMGGFWPWSVVALTRDSGETFDALSLTAEVTVWEGGDAWLESDLGGSVDLTPGSNVVSLSGPEWEGISTLFVVLWGEGDGGGVSVSLTADDFVVRTH